jgi:hypothetical protein
MLLLTGPDSGLSPAALAYREPPPVYIGGVFSPRVISKNVKHPPPPPSLASPGYRAQCTQAAIPVAALSTRTAYR